MSTDSESIPDQPHVVIIGGSLSLMALLNTGIVEQANSITKRSKKSNNGNGITITVIQANDYLEWSLAAPYFLANPHRYEEFISGDKTKFQHPKVSKYVYSPAASVDPVSRLVTTKSGELIGPYSHLICATGYKLPLLHPEPGISYSERSQQIKKWGEIVNKENVKIIINGSGAIGLELAGDIRLANKTAKIVMVARSGVAMNTCPEETQRRCGEVLRGMNVELIKGSVKDIISTNSGTDSDQQSKQLEIFGNLESTSTDVKNGKIPIIGPGKIILDNNSQSYDFDVFLPSFGQSLNTEYLSSSGLIKLDDKTNGLVTNDYLQSVSHNDIYAIGINTTNEGFAAMACNFQGVSICKNILLSLQKKPLKKHVAFEPQLNAGSRPMMIKIGFGKGGYMRLENLPKVGSCMARSCGFPFCLPLGFATCIKSCNCYGCFICGYCCGQPEGELAARGYQALSGIGGVEIFPLVQGGFRYQTFGTKYTGNLNYMNGGGGGGSGGGAPEQMQMKQ